MDNAIEQIKIDDVPRRLTHRWEFVLKQKSKTIDKPSSRFGMLSANKNDIQCYACADMFPTWDDGRQHLCPYEISFRAFTGRMAGTTPLKKKSDLTQLIKRIEKLEEFVRNF